MNDTDRRAVPPAAEVYDEHFVPALFGQWGAVVTEAAEVGPGHRVLDVACGTGALTCAAVQKVGDGGTVVGLDPNEEMLAVARRKAAPIEWTCAAAESLPFEDDYFDRVVSQFGFMFFEDKPRALREAMRVLRPGGRLVFAVCDGLDHSAGYAVLTELLHRLFGPEVAESFRAPFTLGDRERLRALCDEAGIRGARVERHDGTVKFPSITALVSAERTCAWTLGGVLDDPQLDRLVQAADESLGPFTTPDGSLEFLMPALLLIADAP